MRWAKWALLGAVSLAFVMVPYTWGAGNQLLAGFAMVWALIAVSLVVLTGWGGHVSLGQFGIAGVAANLVSRWNVDFVLAHPAVIESYLGTDQSAINRSGAARSSLASEGGARRWPTPPAVATRYERTSRTGGSISAGQEAARRLCHAVKIGSWSPPPGTGQGVRDLKTTVAPGREQV